MAKYCEIYKCRVVQKFCRYCDEKPCKEKELDKNGNNRKSPKCK